MTPAQQATLKADILAKSGTGQPLEAMFVAHDWDGIAAFYNTLAAPSYWVWRTNVTRADLYHKVSAAATFWNWAAYKAQSVVEQNAWVQMFMGDTANFALQNLRSGVKEIFSGSSLQNTQRDHCFAASRRLATVLEKLFAAAVVGAPFPSGALQDTGNNIGATGAATNPAVLDVEGAITGQGILDVSPLT